MSKATLRVGMLGLAASMVASVELRGRRKQSIVSSQRMQPQLVAQTLHNVEDTWLQHATSFTGCDGSTIDCTDGFKMFAKSCENLAMAIVEGSSGDRSVVAEYMSDVCGEEILQGWHRDRCQSLATAMTSAMSIDAASNRNHFESQSVCTPLWTQLLADSKAQAEQERAARAAAEALAVKEKVAREAAEAQAAQEQAARQAADAKAAEEERARAEADKVAEESKVAQAYAENQTLSVMGTTDEHAPAPSKEGSSTTFVAHSSSPSVPMGSKSTAPVAPAAVAENATTAEHTVADVTEGPPTEVAANNVTALPVNTA